MIQLALMIGALSAAVLPQQGQFLIVSETPDALIMIDEASQERTGDHVLVRIIGVFHETKPWRGEKVRFVQFIEEFDCTARMSRINGSASLTEDGREVSDPQGKEEYSAPPQNSPRQLTLNHLCDGAVLPDGGDDFMTRARAYWSH